MSRSNQNKFAFYHGVFFLVSGAWPVLNMKSFEMVTGPKQDHWLVKTVGLLIAATGGALIYSSMKPRTVPKELSLLAAAQAFALGSVSLIYSSKGRISKVYLLDALTEGAIVAGWANFLRRERADSSSSRAGSRIASL